MSADFDATLSGIANDGFAAMQGVFDADECRRIGNKLDAALAGNSDDKTVLRRANGTIYGARNLLAVFPPARTLWRKPRLMELLTSVLGPNGGLVRGLFFDKPPESTWSLPWHQDLTIAVRDHSLPSERFRNRTLKAGVPHVEAPDELLREMLTLRIHLDDVTPKNGPLQVLPGTHTARDAAASQSPVTILANAGDVLAMRPLLSHCSGVSDPATSRRRRVVHLEFAAMPQLPDGYAWHDFLPVCVAESRFPRIYSGQPRHHTGGQSNLSSPEN